MRRYKYQLVLIVIVSLCLKDKVISDIIPIYNMIILILMMPFTIDVILNNVISLLMSIVLVAIRVISFIMIFAQCVP